MKIKQHIKWKKNMISLNKETLYQFSPDRPILSIIDSLYEQLNLKYPKFYKMDILSKAGFLATELLKINHTQFNPEKIAVVLSTFSGCLEVDRKFEESRQSIPSPALFVYTLPNIMLGEICIKNKFKGEQMCTIESGFNADWFGFYISDLIMNRETEACLCGHVEATSENIDIDLFWVTQEDKNKNSLPFEKYLELD